MLRFHQKINTTSEFEHDETVKRKQDDRNLETPRAEHADF